MFVLLERMVCIYLRSVSNLTYHYELFQQFCQHGDDLSFFSFMVGRWVQDYLDKLHSWRGASYDDLVTAHLHEHCARQKSPFVRFIYFICRFVECTMYVASAESKQLAALGDSVSQEHWKYVQSKSVENEFIS